MRLLVFWTPLWRPTDGCGDRVVGGVAFCTTNRRFRVTVRGVDTSCGQSIPNCRSTYHVEWQLLTERLSWPHCVNGLSERRPVVERDSSGRSVAEHSRIRLLRGLAAYCGGAQSGDVAAASGEMWQPRDPSCQIATT